MFIITIHYRHNPLRDIPHMLSRAPSPSTSSVSQTALQNIVTALYLIHNCYYSGQGYNYCSFFYNALTLREGGIYNNTVSTSDDK